MLRFILQFLIFLTISIVMTMVGCDVTTWQWWLVMLMAVLSYLNSMDYVKEDADADND